MGVFTKLTAKDGFIFSAYVAKPTGSARGGLVVLQEIFGVNDHVRHVADGYAGDGYYVVAPALFDRAEEGVDLGYEKEDMEKGVSLRAKIPLEQTLADVAASVEAAKKAGRVGIVGYCWGGSLAWIAAARVPGLAAAVGYYGSMVASHLNDQPRCPVMLHFGAEDKGIPAADVEKIIAAVDAKLVQIFVYPGAGHAFNRDGSAAWHEQSANLARERTLRFLRGRLD